MSRLVASALILIVAATACSSTVEASAVRTVDIARTEASTAAQGQISRAPATVAAQTWPRWALASFDDCDRLLDHIQSEALSRVGAYGLDRGQYGRPLDDDGPLDDFIEDGIEDGMDSRFARDVAEADVESREAEFEPDMGADDMAGDDMGGDDMGDMGPPMDIATDNGGGEAGVEFSETNVQVTGVDEPDIVKTDGRRIITVSKGVLTVVDVTGAEPTVAGHVVLGETPDGELLLHDDRLLAIRNDTGSIRPFEEAAERDGQALETVVIDEVLLDGTPRRGRTMRVEGRYVSSRSVAGTARIVINSFPDEPGFVRPLNRDGVSLADELNRQVVEQTTLSDWLPDYSLVDADDSVLEQGEQFLACDRVHAPGRFGGFGTASVMTINLDEPLAPDGGAATFAVAETVYASLQSLYVATSAWVPASDLAGSEISGRAGERYATSIHKFSFGPRGSAAYEASGSLEGHLLNQFALHERGGHLFVAATEGPPGRFGGTVSRIVALRQQRGDLVEVGEVGDLGRGERIFAVRYIGDRAYVVTFRRVDPLYVVDLDDPTQMAVLGELKIPGFSSYLHPVGDGLLVGVGRDVTESGWDRGLKVSLFDVADATDPREIDTWTLRDASTDIGADHRSFLWWARDQLMVLPVTVPYWGEAPSGAYVFTVTRAGGLEESGRVDRRGAGRDREPVRRSLVIGQDLWTMSASLLQRNDLGTLEHGDRVLLPAADDVSPDGPAAPDATTTTEPVAAPTAEEPRSHTTVTRFADCPGLLGHIRTEVAGAVGAYGFERGRFGRLPDGSADRGGDSASRLLAAGDDSLRDFIDTDGRRIVTTVGDTLTIVDISSTEPSVTGRLPLDLDRTIRLIMRGNRVLVIGENEAGKSGHVSSSGSFDDTVVVREFLVDGEPRRGRSLYIEGRLLDARSNAGRARLVVQSAPRDLGLVYATTEAAEHVAAAGNRQSIERSTLENWLPRFALVAGNGLRLSEGRLLACDDVVAPNEFSGVGLVSALTLNLDRSITSGTAAAIFAEDAATLATGESLYVATESWPASSGVNGTGRESAAADPTSTSIHRFSLSHWLRAAYEASGSIEGSLIGPSPLHEHDGRLFAAAHERASDPRDEGREQRIIVFERNGDRLVRVARSDDLGGRRPITVVRYAGDLVFTHTGHYRYPVRIVDLLDATNPSFAGELPALTSSNDGLVLQPIGDDRLVAVEISRSSSRPSIKVSTSERSDGEFSEIDSLTVTGFTSRAISDPERLRWFDRTRLLVVPVVESVSGGRPRGAAVFGVDAAGEVIYVGNVRPNERPGTEVSNDVFRSVTIGDGLWTLSASRSSRGGRVEWLLQANDVDTLEQRTTIVLNN